MSVEKAIAAGIEPVLDMMVEIETRVKEMEARAPIPGPPGEVDPTTIANLLIEMYGDTLKGEPGEPGVDGNSVSLHEVAGLVAEEFADQLRGPPGDSPDISTIADEVYEKYHKVLKGDPGRDGDAGEDAPEVDLEAVADLVHAKYGDVLKGEPGQNGLSAPLPDISDIAETVVQEHGLVLKGDKGDPGRDGLGINSTTWKEGVFREGSVVQHNFGQHFMAMKDTAEEPGKSEDWQRVGNAGFRWTGLKVDDRDYQDGDWYIDNGTTFMFMGGKGRMIAKRGDVGKTGSKGDKGDIGPAAPMIAEILFDEKGIVVALDNGTVLEAKSEGLENYIVDRINKATEGLENALVIMTGDVRALSEEVKSLRKAKR